MQTLAGCFCWAPGAPICSGTQAPLALGCRGHFPNPPSPRCWGASGTGLLLHLGFGVAEAGGKQPCLLGVGVRVHIHTDTLRSQEVPTCPWRPAPGRVSVFVFLASRVFQRCVVSRMHRLGDPRSAAERARRARGRLGTGSQDAACAQGARRALERAKQRPVPARARASPDLREGPAARCTSSPGGGGTLPGSSHTGFWGSLAGGAGPSGAGRRVRAPGPPRVCAP